MMKRSGTALFLGIISCLLLMNVRSCPDQFRDRDNDGIPDLQDNCPNIANAHQADDDADTIGNVCDNCPLANPDQNDADRDGRGDACDNCLKTNNFDQADRDGDKIGDVCDNCLDYANAGQDDIDQDGIGDRCDPDCLWYRDDDGDGYGATHTKINDCNTQALPYVNDGRDCDDANAAIHPEQSDICGDAIDNDCDGWIDFPRPDCLHCQLTIPDNYAMIQTAINAAQPGDTICVKRGIYQEDLDFSGKNIGIYSLDGPKYTTIQGSHGRSVVTFAQGETNAAVLDGFTIRNGYGPTGGGGIYVDGAAPVLRNLIISDNVAAAGSDGVEGYNMINGRPGWPGGGIFLRESAARLMDLVIENNQAGAGGAGYVAPYSEECQCILGTHGEGGQGGNGGGIFMQDSAIQLERVRLIRNSAGQGGCAPDYSGDGGDGGGIFSSNSQVYISQLSLIQNSAGDIESGDFCYSRYNYGGNGGGIYLINSDPELMSVDWRNMVLLANRAGRVNNDTANLSGLGGGIWVEGNFMLSNSTLFGNAARDGGGIFDFAGSALIVSTTISDSRGSGISSLFATITVAYGNSWHNTPDDYNGLADPTGFAGNIVADPQFCDTTSADPSQWDLHLGGGSPLIDAGYPALSDVDGSPADIGAYGGPGGGW